MASTIALLAFGSQGDTRPVVALGAGLRRRGHRVRILAARRFAGIAESAGLEHTPMDMDPLEILASDSGQEFLSSRHPVTLMRNFRRVVRPMAEEVLDQALGMTRGADAVLAPATGFVGYHLAEHLRIPTALLHLQPGEPTSSAANPLVLAGRSLPGPLNRLSYSALEQLTWQLIRPIVDDWRGSRLGLPPIGLGGPFRAARRAGVPVLAGWSPAAVPPAPDWPGTVHVTGWWFLEDGPLAPEVEDFLGAGPPPVYVGFGSMVPGDPEEVGEAVRQALDAVGVRGVVVGEPAPGGERAAEAPRPAAGQADDGPASALAVAARSRTILTAESVPHSRLFPRTAAVVHHGGAGTTGAGLRAGVPAVVCPFFADQPFWARQLAELGVAPEPLPIKALTAGALAARIHRATTDGALRTRARVLGQRMAPEDGVERACDVVEAWLPRAEPPGRA